MLDLVRELGATVVRYPGGNFVSGLPLGGRRRPGADRPRRLDGAWHTVETNAFGLHEFVDWAREAGVELMEAVNLGTRGVEEARALVEYANHPGGTELSDLRRKNGHDDPFDIKLWCLGNEMDGPWQIGAKTADEYGRLRRRDRQGDAARRPEHRAGRLRLLRLGDADLRRVGADRARGTRTTRSTTSRCTPTTRSTTATTRASWPAPSTWTTSSSPWSPTADAVRAAGKHRKQINLSFDEWNVWYQTGKDTEDQPHVIAQAGIWREHPRIIEDEYTVTDAVVVGTLLNSLLRHGDRVKIANQAQLVNVIAPIRTEEGGPAWRQSIFWPFARTAAPRPGRRSCGPRSRPTGTRRAGSATSTWSTSAATWDEENGRVALFLAHRGLDEDADVDGRPARLDGRAGHARRGARPCPTAATGTRPTRRTRQDRVGLVRSTASVPTTAA